VLQAPLLGALRYALQAMTSCGPIRCAVAAATLIGVVCAAGVAAAQPIRVHGTLGGAMAVGGHQADELGPGLGYGLGAEIALVPQLGLGLRVTGAWLGEAAEPGDPTVKGEGDAAALGGGISVTVLPWATEYDGSSLSLSGVWLGATGGVATTGGREKWLVEGQAGWDLYHPKPNFGIGPMVGWMHVFQPDGQLRPDDANVVMAGIHGRWWYREPTEEEIQAARTDQDNDRIFDDVDKCPDAAEDMDGFQDEDGCPDLDNDGDGNPDLSDACPREAEDKDRFQDEDGCPDPDDDGDGLLDEKDKCPGAAEDMDGFEDEDGCPDLDDDQDGIPDREDLCPKEPETVNGYADRDGCPDEDQVRVIGGKIVLDERVHFPTASTQIGRNSYAMLERLAKLIREHPEYSHVSIEGHADERGAEDYNLRLSSERAQAVLEFLVKHGVDRARLSSQGFGSSRPLAEKGSPNALYLNRRVELVVTRGQGGKQ